MLSGMCWKKCWFEEVIDLGLLSLVGCCLRLCVSVLGLIEVPFIFIYKVFQFFLD